MKAALIGYGYWGKIIHKYLLNNKDIDLIGICSPNYKDSIPLDNLISQHIDCAFVCTPIETHYDIVKTLLLNNINVFCEKPLCKMSKEVTEIIQIAREKQLILFTDYIYTYSNSIKFIKQNLNKYGNVQFVDMEISQFGNFYENDNVFDVIGVHLISILCFLFPDEQINIEKLLPIKKSERNNIEAGIIILSIGNKTYVCIKCSLVSNIKVRRINITCENGLIVFDMLSDKTVTFIAHKNLNKGYVQSDIQYFSFDEKNNLINVISEFVKSVLEKKQSDENVIVSKKVTSLLEKIDKNVVKF